MSTTKSGLDVSLVRELAAILRDADLGEVEIEHDGLRIRVSRGAPAPVQTYVPAPQAAPHLVGAPATGPAPVTAAAAAPVALANAVTSPMVGTVYLSSDPASKPFVAVGDKVAKGDTLMLIEAMKTFNPVVAAIAGTVTRIIVSDAQPVEYGEPLIVIE